MVPGSWKRDFASGLAVLVPILAVAFVVGYVYSIVLGVSVISNRFPADTPSYVKVVVTLVIFLLLVLSVGYLMRTTLGDVVEGTVDDLMNRLPGLRIVYNASKMAVETAVTGTDELQAPVKLETWNGLRMTAFKTGKRTDDGRDVLFLPTAPNITTGFVIEVEPDRYEVTNERVEDALTRILSAGFGESRDAPVALEEVVPDSEEGGGTDDENGERDEPVPAASDEDGEPVARRRDEDGN